MRTVFNNRELAHVWSSQSQERGSNSSDSMYFIGNIIYSYGDHYPIAKIFDKENIVLFNSVSSTVTTESKHKNQVRRAISHLRTFYVPSVVNPNHRENIKHYYSLIEKYLDKASRSRVYKDMYLNLAKTTYQDLKDYVKLFKLKTKVKPLVFSDDVLNSIKESNKEQAKKNRLKKIKEQKKIQKELDTALNDFRENGKTIPYRLNQYIKGNICHLNDSELTTNGSCRVPLKDVKRLLLAVNSGIDVNGMKAGVYKVTSGTLDKIVIGCHVFYKEEINIVRKKLNIGVK